MTIAVRPPTSEEMRSYNRRRAFHRKIAVRAAALAQQHHAAASLKAECLPAEPDPPTEADASADCAQCVALKAALEAYQAPASIGRAHPPIKSIQILVARYYDITRGDICSERRLAEVVRPRQIAMYLAKELTPLSLPRIGRDFGGRDHTTVLHAFRKISAMVFADAQFAAEVISLRVALETGEAD